MTKLFPRLGCAVAPLEATEEMIRAEYDGYMRSAKQEWGDAYKVMLTARPAICLEAENAIEALVEAARELTRMHHSCDLGSRMGMYCYLCALKEKVAALEALKWKTTEEPKFAETSCSHCGGTFGPGDHGFSHCEHHRHLRRLS